MMESVGTSESYDIKSYLLTPLMLHFRGLNEQLAPYPVSKFTRIGGVREAGPTEYLFKIDSDNSIVASVDGPKDHAITRLLYTHRGVATERLDTTFERKESLGFCPTKWVRTRYDGQPRPTQITTVTVEKLEAPSSIAGSQFEIEFPSGTIVEDQRLPYSGPNESLAVADDRGFFSRNRWLLLSGCVVALGVVVVLSRRHRTTQGDVESH